MERIRVAVIGAGYWGPNVIRTLLELPDAELASVCDQRAGRLRYVAERFPGVPLTDRSDDVLGDRSIDAVALVTPVGTHRPLAEAALRAGKHVFVEKPLAPSVVDAEAMVETAARLGRTLAVGHIFVYHAAVAALRGLARGGGLGRLCYAESGRVNLGPPASEVDAIWDLAVHDVSILLSILDAQPVEVTAAGRNFVHPALVDAAFLTLRFPDGFIAQHHVSWLSPVKVRRFFIAGTEGAATYDDTRDDDKLVISGRGEDSRLGAAAEAGELFYRPGPVRTVTLDPTPPLTAELARFVASIRSGRAPEADGRAGLAVVRVLEAAERSIAEGRPVAVGGGGR